MGAAAPGKTHILRVLQAKNAQNPDTVVVYVDARTLGSSALFTDPDRPMHSRLLGLFRDVVLEVQGALFEHYLAHEPHDPEAALDLLAALETAANYQEPQGGSIKDTTRATAGRTTGGAAKASLGLTGLGASGELKLTRRKEPNQSTRRHRAPRTKS